MGIENIKESRLNKGLAFSVKERQLLRIHGLIPPRYKSQEEQLEMCKISIERYDDDLNKYIYLTELQDRNERLFYRFVSENIKTVMPILYTPTVGAACQTFGLVFRRPRGLFITIHDIGHVYDIIQNWPEHNVKAIVVTDGERILGLGDLGAHGMGIPVGKLALYTILAGFKPWECLPITLDVGTNNEKFLKDPLYVGICQKRVTGQIYDDFVDEFMKAVVKRYGQNTLIQFEDFGNHNAFRLLQKYRDQYCTFNDDIQGTASIILSGLLASKRLTNKELSNNRWLFFGAGEAAIGIADLVVIALQNEGLSIEEARNKIWMMDIDGLLTTDRPDEGLQGNKKFYAKNHAPSKDLAAIVTEIRPSMLIGASACGGAFTPEILKKMACFNEKPIIFALSNPTIKAECTAEEAYVNTRGRGIFSSGSPFGPVKFRDKEFHPGQGNNAYVYPGIALGVVLAGIHHIKDEIFIIASKTVASKVSDEDLDKGSLYPPISSIKECSKQIACQIIEYAYKENIATVYPQPENVEEYVESSQYDYNYESSLAETWPWPDNPA